MEIADYLKNKRRPNAGKNYYVGVCKVRETEIPWKMDRIISHKTGGNCERQEESEKQSFLKSKKKRKTISTVSEVSITSSITPTSQSTPQSTPPTFPLYNFVDRLNKEGLEQLKDACGQIFYRTGIPFRVTESKAMLNFVKLIKPTFAKCLPSAKQLGGVMLNRKYIRLKELATQMLNSCSAYSIVSDGWSNIRNEHSISTAGINQTAEQVATDILDVIRELGDAKCVSVVTDNTPNMRGAWNIIESAFPKIYCNGVMNLLIKDICTLPIYQSLLE